MAFNRCHSPPRHVWCRRLRSPDPGRIAGRAVWAHDAHAEQEDGLHDHRQFARREGSVSPGSAHGQVPVRRAGGARPPRLAGIGVPAGRFAATFSSSPVTTTEATNSSPISVEAREFLPVDEMERVSCSDSCPGLFSQLKEVYLFGCNTLNAGANRSASAEIERSLVRSGHSRADAERMARALSVRHGESSRDRMRQIFMNVPAIYGFSSVAPLGPTAASILSRYFQAAGTARSAAAAQAPGCSANSAATRWSSRAVSAMRIRRRPIGATFASSPTIGCRRRRSSTSSMGCSVARWRRSACSSTASRNTRRRCSDTERQAPAVAGALDDIARDQTARARYLDFARDADQPAVRARMLKLAQDLGWLVARGAAGRD